MRICIIESPFKGATKQRELLHRRYLNLCIRDACLRGETPYASHKMLTDSLDDSDPKERELGIGLGFRIRQHFMMLHRGGFAQVVTAVYQDFGLSGGMLHGINDADKHGCPVERRNLWQPGCMPEWAVVL